MRRKNKRFVPVPGAISYFIRYTPAQTPEEREKSIKKRRETIPAGRDFGTVFTRFLNIENDQNRIRQGLEPTSQPACESKG